MAVTPRSVKTGSLAVLASVLLALGLAGCPGRGGVARPAPVELDWPDAASQAVPAMDAGL